jgi:hypothetical protein
VFSVHAQDYWDDEYNEYDAHEDLYWSELEQTDEVQRAAMPHRKVENQKREKKFKPDVKSRYKSRDFDYTEKAENGYRPNEKLLGFFAWLLKWGGLTVLLVIIILVIRALVLDGGGFWRAANKSKGLYEIVDETVDFENVDYLSLAINASKNGEFKLAIRYYFLAYLQQLNKDKIIDFHPDKTNREYRYEIEDWAQRNDFDTLCKIFDYCWYGDRDLTSEQYKNAESNFMSRLNHKYDKSNSKSSQNSGYTRTYIILFLLGAGLFSCEYRPVDWEEYYKTNKRTPYGLYVLSKELETMKPGFLKVEKIKQDVHQYFSSRRYEYQYQVGLDHNYTFFYIDKHAKMQKYAIQSVLDDFVYFGNQAFVSVNNMPKAFFEHANIELVSDLVFSDRIKYTVLSDDKKYPMDRVFDVEYFIIHDTALVLPLGYVEVPGSNEKRCNFLAYGYGDGMVFLHASPEMFTNYSFLSLNNAQYVESVFAYLHRNKVLWFNDYREERNEDEYGLLSYIMSQPGLKAAWYMLWLILLLFALTKVKRTQRIIPIVQAKKNFSVDYARRMAEFHVLEKNYYGLIEHQILLVLDKLRTEYRLDTTQIDDSFALKMHHSANCNIHAAREFVTYLKKQRSRTVAFDFDFKELTKILKKLNLK